MKYNILCIDVVLKRAHIVILLPEEFSAFIRFTSRAANIFHASTIIMDARKNIAEEQATFIIFIYLSFFFYKSWKLSGQISVGEKSLSAGIAVVVRARLIIYDMCVCVYLPTMNTHNIIIIIYYYYYRPLRCTWLYYYGVRLSALGGDSCS